MKYICKECMVACAIDSGNKARTWPDICPWVNVTSIAKWKPAATQPADTPDKVKREYTFHSKEAIERLVSAVRGNLR